MILIEIMLSKSENLSIFLRGDLGLIDMSCLLWIALLT